MQSSRSKRARSLSGELQWISRALLFTQEFFFCSISEDNAEIEGGGDAGNEEGDEREPEVPERPLRPLGAMLGEDWEESQMMDGAWIMRFLDLLRSFMSNC